MKRLEQFISYFSDYNRLVFKVSYDILHDRVLAEDALQEAFVSLFIRMGYSEKIENVSSWLCKTAKNAAIDYLRKESHFAYEPIDEDIPDDAMDKLINKIYTTEMLKRLKDRNEIWYEVVMLHIVEGLKLDEVAEKLLCSKQSVKNYLYRAKKYLDSLDNEEIVLFIIILYFIKTPPN